MLTAPKSVYMISFFGFIPFLPGVIFTIGPSEFLGIKDDIFINLSLVYAGLILSFLSGCLFSFEVTKNSNPKWIDILIILLPTIWVLIALNIAYVNFRATALALGFLITYELDNRYSKKGLTPKWWLSLRLPLTTLVIISLIVMGFHD